MSKSWWHCCSFNRAHSPEDEALARELLLEWGQARGLRWVHEGTTHITGLLMMMGMPAELVHVERDNYGQWAGYAMEFVPADAKAFDYENPPAPTRKTRLKNAGSPAGFTLRGREEYYDPPADKETEPCPPSDHPAAPASQ